MSANELIDKLRHAHGKGWYIGITAMGQVSVDLSLGTHRRHQITADTFEQAVEAAIAWRDIPELPRRPYVLCSVDVVRDGSKWRIKSGDYDLGGNIKTKKLAVEYAERALVRSQAAADEWDAKIGPYVKGVEGVDYRWRVA